IPLRSYTGASSNDEVLIAGPGCRQSLADNATKVKNWLKSGGNLVAIGLDQSDADALLPFKATMRSAEHISSYFESSGVNSLLCGIGPADVHNRDPRELPLVVSGARVVGDGVLATVERTNVVFLQMPPWQFAGEQPNLRRTHRRLSFLLNRLLEDVGVSNSTP